MAVGLLLAILLKILMVDTYLDGGLDLLLLLNDGGIGCVIRTVDRSIPLNLMDDIRTAALARTLMDQLLVRSFSFDDHSLVRIFSGGEAMEG